MTIKNHNGFYENCLCDGLLCSLLLFKIIFSIKKKDYRNDDFYTNYYF